MKITLDCSCGKRLSVPAEHAGKKVKCPGCAALLPILAPATPAPAPEQPATPAQPRPARTLLWILVGGGAAALLAVALVVFFVARSAVRGTTGGPGVLNVDNISAEPVQVSVDGQALGTVKPFEVGIYPLEAGEHEIVVSASGREIDREKAPVPAGKTLVFNPKARGTYYLGTSRYSGGATSATALDPKPLGKPRTVAADFGLLEPVPRSIVTRPGEHGMVLRTKVYREPPMSFTPAEAVSFLGIPTGQFAGSPNHYTAAFRALAAAPGTKGAGPALLACLDQDGLVDLRQAFALIWEHSIDLPEERLRSWVSSPASGFHAPTRAANAFLLLVEKGRAGTLGDLSTAQVRRLRDGHLNAILGNAAPARGRAAFRGLLDAGPAIAGLALEALKSVQHDLETAKRVDEFISKLPPAGPPGRRDERRDWVEAWLSVLETHAPNVPKDEVNRQRMKHVSDLPGGTGQSELIQRLFREIPVAELTALYPTLKPAVRDRFAFGLPESLSRDPKPLTEDHFAFIDLVFRTPFEQEILRASFFTRLVTTARRAKDARLAAKLKEIAEREPDPKMKERFQSTMDQVLKNP